MCRLQTERLVLRPFHEGDLDALFALHSDPAVVQFVGTGKPRTYAEMREWIERVMGHWNEHGFGLWVVLDRKDGAFVGWCGAAYLHGLPDPELACTLARRYWGTGLATGAIREVLCYAFEVLGVPRVVGVARIENVASQRIMQKAGLTFQERIQYDGHDAVMYAIENPGRAD